MSGFNPEEEGKVDMLMAVMGEGVSREQARFKLQARNWDVNNTINSFFDDDPMEPEIGPRWDSNLHTADRYGNPDQSNGGLSYNIDLPLGVDNYPHSTAPTRPPSRVSQRSDMHPDQPLQSVEREHVHGPANRVPETTASDCPPASGRVRQEDAPAFLKPFSNNNPLPALVTILHSISQCRNIFLAPNYHQDSYAVSADWWNADPTSIAEVYKSYRNEHLVREMQRLVAFLDRTQRAYGSVGKLQNLGGWQTEHEGKPVTHWFPAIMDVAYTQQRCTLLGSAMKSEWQGDGAVPSTERYSLTTADASTIPWEDPNLYDALDGTLYYPDKELSLLLIPANVQVIHLKNSDANAFVKIPSWLYLGRYSFDRKDAIKAVLKEQQTYSEAMWRIDAELEEIKYEEHGGKKHDALKCIETSMHAFQPDSDGNFPNPKHKEVREQLQKVHDFVAKRIQELESERQDVMKEMDVVRSQNRELPGASTHGADMRYVLCGFTAGPNMYYIRQRYGSGIGQWWSFSWTPGHGCIVLHHTEEAALEEAGKGGKDTMLVYATEAALEEPLTPLTQELRDFVDQDNARFQQELADEPPSSWQLLPEANIEPLGGWDMAPSQYAEANADPKPWDVPVDYGIQIPTAKQGYYPNTENDDSSRTLTPNIEEAQEMGVAMPKESQRVVSNFLKTKGWKSKADADVDRNAAGSDVEMGDRDSPGGRAQHIEDVDAEGEGKDKEDTGSQKYGSNNPYKPIVEREQLL